MKFLEPSSKFSADLKNKIIVPTFLQISPTKSKDYAILKVNDYGWKCA